MKMVVVIYAGGWIALDFRTGERANREGIGHGRDLVKWANDNKVKIMNRETLTEELRKELIY